MVVEVRVLQMLEMMGYAGFGDDGGGDGIVMVGFGGGGRGDGRQVWYWFWWWWRWSGPRGDSGLKGRGGEGG